MAQFWNERRIFCRAKPCSALNILRARARIPPWMPPLTLLQLPSRATPRSRVGCRHERRAVWGDWTSAMATRRWAAMAATAPRPHRRAPCRATMLAAPSRASAAPSWAPSFLPSSPANKGGPTDTARRRLGRARWCARVLAVAETLMSFVFFLLVASSSASGCCRRREQERPRRRRGTSGCGAARQRSSARRRRRESAQAYGC